MDLQRYFIAATLSLTVHIAMLWSAAENKAYAIPLGTTSAAVSINFAAVKAISRETTAAPEKKLTATKQPASAKKTQKKNSDKKVVKKKTTTQKTAKAEVKNSATTAAQAKNKPLDTQQSSAPALAGATEKPVLPVLIDTPRFLFPPAAPRYPRLARRKGIEGTVTYEVWLDEQGRQIKLMLKDSSGTALLDGAALQAIEKWKFSPHKINGQGIAQRVLIPIKFKLD